MRRILFEIPGLEIPIFAYGFMIMCGFLAAIFFAARRARRMDIKSDAVLDMGIYTVIFGVLGARFFFIVQFHERFSFVLFDIFDGRISIIGLILGVALAVGLYLYRRRIKFLRAFHTKGRKTTIFFTIVGIILTIAFGRALYPLIVPVAQYHTYSRPESDFVPGSLKKEEITPQIWCQCGIAKGTQKSEVRTFGFDRYKFPPATRNESEFVPNSLQRKEFKYGIWVKEGVWKETQERVVHAYGLSESHSIGEGGAKYLFRGAITFDVFEIWRGGLVYFGGILGGVLTGLVFTHRRRIRFWRFADVLAPAVMLGLAFGRVG